MSDSRGTRPRTSDALLLSVAAELTDVFDRLRVAVEMEQLEVSLARRSQQRLRVEPEQEQQQRTRMCQRAS